ncbi:hypothetical protein D3C87_1902400 [compost metagenome]
MTYDLLATTDTLLFPLISIASLGTTTVGAAAAAFTFEIFKLPDARTTLALFEFDVVAGVTLMVFFVASTANIVTEAIPRGEVSLR